MTSSRYYVAIEQRRRGVVRQRWTIGRVMRGIRKRGPAALADCLATFAAYQVAVGVRTGGRIETYDPLATAAVALGAGLLQIVMNVVFEIYWRDWSIAALEDLVALVKSTSLVMIALMGLDLATPEHAIPFGAVVTGAGLVLIAESAIKLRPRWRQILHAALGRRNAAESVVVVGAGATGQLFARYLSDGTRDYRIACYVDDDVAKTGTYVRGIRIAGRIEDLSDIIEVYAPSTVVIALPNLRGPIVRQIVEQCEGADVKVRAVSGFSLRTDDTTPLRSLSIEELLERDPVELDTPEAHAYVAGQRVLITGAAGSIGSEIARQVCHFGPDRLILLDNNESGLHELRLRLGSQAVELALGDIRDSAWLGSVVQSANVDVIFHAAAYKHVPILEEAPLAGVTANVLGTANLLRASVASNVARFVFISTDKAVEPTNVLGMTKRLGELLTLAFGRASGRRFAVVRFGNVLGSNGSVVPLFTQQIDDGGPVTVTHPETTRYFMTIREAAGLVIEAGAIAEVGDLFVLDMGEPVRIADLAQKMIRLRGLRIPADIEITYTGLRPGEKLHEELVFPAEIVVATRHPRVTKVVYRDDVPSLESLQAVLSEVEQRCASQDASGAIGLVREVTSGERAWRGGAVATGNPAPASQPTR